MAWQAYFWECLSLPVDNYGHALKCPRKAAERGRQCLAMMIPRRPVIALYGVWHGPCYSIRRIIPVNPARQSGKERQALGLSVLCFRQGLDVSGMAGQFSIRIPLDIQKRRKIVSACICHVIIYRIYRKGLG